MIDLSKIPTKVFGFAIALFALFVLSAFWYSLSANRPVYFNGKEFGFSSSELNLKITQLEGKIRASQAETINTLQSLRVAEQKIASLSAEIDALQEATARRTALDSQIWSPVDNIDFSADGTFTAAFGKRAGRGKWKSEDSELILHLVDHSDSSVILGTNLPDPWTKLEVHHSKPLVFPMQKWNYRIIATHIYSEWATVRVERRPKIE